MTGTLGLLASATTPLGWTAFGISAVAGTLNGIGNVLQGQREVEARKAEAQYNIEQLGAQLDRLLESFNENQEQLDASLDQTIDANNQGLWATQLSQGINAQLSSKSNASNQALMYAQLASMQRQNRQSVGSAIQTVATSGFRNTEGSSAGNVIRETERAADESYNQALEQIRLSAYGSYLQASSDYFSANVQIESYKESTRNAKENYSLQSAALSSQYEYDKMRTEAEREYWQGVYDSAEYTFWDGLGDFFGGFF